MSKTISKICLLTAALLLCAPTQAMTVSLYDADDLANPLPSDQGSLSFLGLFATQTASAGGVDFDSTVAVPISGFDTFDNRGGYNATPLSLDSASGITLDFDLQVLSEVHTSADRSGFNVIVISQDTTAAIEIAFWENEIWAQNDGFTHGESAVFDTTAAMTTYSLNLLGSGYSLLADGIEVLTGALRDYSGYNGGIAPYTGSNFIYFGDNTTRAQSLVTLGDISLTTVPIPPAIFLMLGALAVMVVNPRRHQPAIT